MRAICPDENPPDSETPESTFSALAHEFFGTSRDKTGN